MPVTYVLTQRAQSTQKRTDRCPKLFLLLRRRGRRSTKDVFIEPVQVVLHHGAARLRLRWTVADALESFIDDQLRRDADVLEPSVQLVGVGRRHALIGRTVLDQRRRLGVLDVSDRRGLRV